VPLLYHFADKIICVSKAVAEDLRQYASLPESKMRVILNPSIREEIFRLKEEAVSYPWLVPGQSPVLLAVGGLRPEKNYDLLVRAFAEIDKKYNARLLILGEGPERATLERQVRDLNISAQVDMPGFKKNPYAYMARSAIFIMCSDSEGMPNAVIEALACDCPVIATDCPGGMREILGDSRYGLLVPVGDQKKLTVAMDNILGNLKQAKSRTAAFQREKMQEFTPETVIPQYMEAVGLNFSLGLEQVEKILHPEEETLGKSEEFIEP
jgi:glycosyltransferase involved in cell wall biosynthesis